MDEREPRRQTPDWVVLVALGFLALMLALMAVVTWKGPHL